MIIAIDVREASGAKTGKGFYNLSIVENMLKQSAEQNLPFSFLLYGNTKENPFKDYTAEYINISSKGLWWHLRVLKDIKARNVNLFFSPVSFIIPALAPKKIRTIITVHDLVAFMFPSTHNKKAVLIEKLTLRRALKKVSGIFVVSENTKADLIKKFKIDESKIVFTRCAPAEFFKQPINLAEAQNIKEKYNLPEKFILSVGTMEPRKNLTTLIKSFVVIKRKKPDVKLVIVGKKGWRYDMLEKVLKHYKLENEIIFPGYIEDHELKYFYALATVFVFPSLYEGFGIPPLEAMSCGCPVISSNIASLPEVVSDAGILIDPNSSMKIADSVCSLIDNEHARNVLIAKGRERVTYFTWQKSAENALNYMKTLI